LADGCSVDYLLHDEPVRFLKGKLRLRQVTRLCDGGHQTTVITSRWDPRDIEVAYANVLVSALLSNGYDPQ
jgi:hypothetical protein